MSGASFAAMGRELLPAPMKLLAVDTSTDACSAALYIDGAVAERFAVTPRGHAEHILPMVEDLLEDAALSLARLDALAFGRGPGSFTGVRIAAGVIQGLALGAGLAVVPVSSLAALAQGASADRILAAIDARMDEVYWGEYLRGDDGLVRVSGRERVTAPMHIPLPDEGHWTGVGSGWDRYADTLQQCLGEKLDGWLPGRYPHARDIAILGADGYRGGLGVAAELALPVYLRDEVVRRPDPR
jgi:tRNA threonylcarbamoyladenosine biosynthesis protein TsaB